MNATFPSIGWALRLAGFRANMVVNGFDLLWQGSGANRKFRAIVSAMNPLDVEALLGSDIREAATMEGIRDEMPSMSLGDLIKQGSETWKVIRRNDTPSDPTVKFTIVKTVPGKDK